MSDTDLCARCGGDCPMTSCPECGGCENTRPGRTFLACPVCTAPDTEWDDYEDDYDPGPEADDEGGMSEYRYILPEDYGRGQS